MGSRLKRKAKIEAARNLKERFAFSSRDVIINSVIKMKCVVPNTSLVPSCIKYNGVYFRDESVEFHGDKLGVSYGLFFNDSLLTDYAGMEDLDYMEEI